MSSGIGDRLVAATPLATLGLGLLALFMGFEWFWMVFVLGFAVATPLVAVLFGDTDDDWEEYAKEAAGMESDADGETSKEDALETLRDRYARGELSEAEFERKLEQLLGTETLEEARRRVDGDGEAGREPTAGREPERERS